jgi:hypothetical protein
MGAESETHTTVRCTYEWASRCQHKAHTPCRKAYTVRRTTYRSVSIGLIPSARAEMRFDATSRSSSTAAVIFRGRICADTHRYGVASPQNMQRTANVQYTTNTPDATYNKYARCNIRQPHLRTRVVALPPVLAP